MAARTSSRAYYDEAASLTTAARASASGSPSAQMISRNSARARDTTLSTARATSPSPLRFMATPPYLRTVDVRWSILVALVVGILAAPLATDAQQPSRVPRIGYLEFGTAAPGTSFLEAFRQGLRDLGWVEGQNIAIEVRYAEGKRDQLPELAAELVRRKVDLIFASTTPAALAAKHATRQSPSSSGLLAIRLGAASSPAWRAQGATSRGGRMSRVWRYSGSVWS